MAAGKHDITIEQGADFTLTALYTNSEGAIITLTGWTGRMQIRQSPSSPSPVVSLPGVDGTITITGAAGKVEVFIPAETTAQIALYGKSTGTFAYDLEIVETATGRVKRLLKGTATVDAEITR